MNGPSFESGVTWPLPVVLDIGTELADNISSGERVRIEGPDDIQLMSWTQTISTATTKPKCARNCSEQQTRVVRLITQWISSDDVGFESEDVFVAGGEIPHPSIAMANSIPSHRPFVGS